MAITVPIISEFRDAGLKKAEAEIQGFGKRAGAALRNLSTGQVAAAGAAIGAFGVKAVMAFQNAALEAGKFADATGIAVEDASRWVEVSGDLGIEAGAVQSAMQRLNKAIGEGSPIIEQLGLQISRTAEGTVDANKTFQNAITTIGGIEDPTLRAKAAQELFGRGYGEIARFMTMSAGELQTALQEVSDTKVFTPEERDQARKFQASLDTLKDTTEDLTIEVGQALIPIMEDLFDAVYVVDAAIAALTGETDGGGIAALLNVAWEGSGLAQLVDFVNQMGDQFGLSREPVSDLATDFDVMKLRAQGLNREMLTTGTRLGELKSALEEVKTPAELLDEAFFNLKDTIADRKAWEQFYALMYMFRSDADLSTEEADTFALALGEVVMELDDMPDSVRTELLTELDARGFDEFDRRMRLYGDRRVTLKADFLDPIPRALGGPVSTATPYLVGERGPELFVPAQSGHIVPNHGLPTGNTVININTSADPNEVVRALETFRRRNGSLPL